jgi:hypothetical protein
MGEFEDRISRQVRQALGDKGPFDVLRALEALAARGELVESSPGVFDMDIGFGILPPVDDPAGDRRLQRAEEKRRRKAQRRLTIIRR